MKQGVEFKKVEIIERITDSNGNVTENMLTVWKNLNLNNNSANLRIGELEICESKRQVKKNEEHIYLTESSKSPASIAQSNKQWVGTCLYQEWYKPLLISCEAAIRL